MAEVDDFINAIAMQETGGEPNPYQARWGKYAINPAYVASMSQLYLGRTMTSDQYLSSPALQDELGRAALTALYNRYGVDGAASSWYSGNPNLSTSTRAQPGGPSIANYVASVRSKMGVGGGTSAAADLSAAQPVAAPAEGSQLDTDHDGLTDAYERSVGTDPNNPDSDYDGLMDGFEVAGSRSNPLSADSDQDGLADATEVALGTDPSSADTDHDGLTDQVEVRFGTNPVAADAGDGLPPSSAPGMSATATALASATAAPTALHVTVPTAPAPPPTSSQAPGRAEGPIVDRFVQAAVNQRGDRYVYGAETSLSDPNPKVFDCSELTQWAAHQAGVTIPDGAEYQYMDLKQKHALVSVEEALHTKGALLFYFSSEPTPANPRPSRAHVAISLGDGRTIEARGRAYGVDEFSAKNRFNYAGVIPGISATDAAPTHPEPAVAPAVTTASYEIDQGTTPDRVNDTDHDGLTDAFERLARTGVTRADTDSDGLSDSYEALVSHTDPLSADTDTDGAPDAMEASPGAPTPATWPE